MNFSNRKIRNNKDRDLDQATRYLKHRYKNIDKLIESFPSKSVIDNKDKEKLIITDLFVEKDIQILTRRAKSHAQKGYLYFLLTIILFFLGTFISIWLMFTQINNPNVKILHWSQMLQLFIKPFTAYGFIVLTAVSIWKQSKAELDQSQRIYEKRRTNRFLRTFIYLKNSGISIDEIETLLKLGDFNSNAFSNIKAMSKSPAGGAISDISTAFAGILNKLSIKTNDNKAGS